MLTPDPAVPGALLEDEGDFVPDDPRPGVLIVTGLPAWMPDGARTFDLSVRSRRLVEPGSVLELTVASDEALLQKFAQLVDDKTPRTHQASLRAVCNYVIGTVIPGASLASDPSVDADVTAYWAVTNRLTNPSIETDVAGWIPGFGATNLRQAVTGTAFGTHGILWNANAGSSAVVAAPQIGAFSVRPGQSCVFLFEAYGGAAKPAQAVIQWYASSGAVFFSEVRSAPVVLDTTGVFKWLAVVAVAPRGATGASPLIIVEGTANGEAYIADAAMFYEGTEVVPYFDGSTLADAHYTYAWAGTPHASPSTRTPIVDRPPESLTWKAGVSAWDFLQPLLTSVRLRLFCDEARVWRLVPLDYALPLALQLTGQVTSDASDTITLDGDTVHADGVVVRYLWDDPIEGAKVQLDTAGNPGTVMLVERKAPYPGPGAAAALLTVAQSRGRAQDLSALTDYRATPGVESRIPLRSGEILLGRIRSVQFEFGSAFMQISSKDQAETSPDAIDLLTGTIDALTGTIDDL